MARKGHFGQRAICKEKRELWMLKHGKYFGDNVGCFGSADTLRVQINLRQSAAFIYARAGQYFQ